MKKLGLLLLTLIAILLISYFAFPQWILKGLYNYELRKGNFKTETLEINGETYYYLDNRREDLPTMVLLHGYSDTKGSWVSFINPISEKYRIIIPDLMGHGDNPKDFNISYDFVSQAVFVKQVTDKLKLPDFHLIGISMGGAVSGHFAHKYPEKVKTLTLISNAGINDYANLSKVDSLMLLYPSVEEKIENLPLLPKKLDKESLNKFKKYLFIQPLFTPNQLFKVYLNRLVVYREFNIKVLKDLIEPETRQFKNPLNDILAEIKVPVNIIWGKQDPLLDVSSVEVMTSIMTTKPDVTIIDACGHGTIAEKPEETMEAMTKFLK
jgi:pimeloyl-ACP methyl ester carboxylesterase